MLCILSRHPSVAREWVPLGFIFQGVFIWACQMFQFSGAVSGRTKSLLQREEIS
jgi:hypothetical protein